jgi:hypothetical protein
MWHTQKRENGILYFIEQLTPNVISTRNTDFGVWPKHTANVPFFTAKRDGKTWYYNLDILSFF